MVIEPPHPAEESELVVLAQATGFFNAEEVGIVKELLDEFFARPEAGEYCWLVYRETPGGPALGFACYGPVSMSEDVYDLYWIAVHPASQGKLVGTALLHAVEQDLLARNARQLYIETSDTDQYTPTRGFYRRRGYEQVAHFSDYYRVGDGKVVFRKVFREK